MGSHLTSLSRTSTDGKQYVVVDDGHAYWSVFQIHEFVSSCSESGCLKAIHYRFVPYYLQKIKNITSQTWVFLGYTSTNPLPNASVVFCHQINFKCLAVSHPLHIILIDTCAARNRYCSSRYLCHGWGPLQFAPTTTGSAVCVDPYLHARPTNGVSRARR